MADKEMYNHIIFTQYFSHGINQAVPILIMVFHVYRAVPKFFFFFKQQN